MSKYTPAPWAEFNRDGARIFKRWGVQGANGQRVCWVENGPHCDKDARLIAAAPDMLAALLDAGEIVRQHNILSDGPEHNRPDLHQERIDTLRRLFDWLNGPRFSAIAKAII